MSFYLNPMNNTGLGRFESVHRPGSNVTIYCSIEGSNNVTFQWKIGKLNDFSSISLYPALNPKFERVEVEPACSRYRHSSTLKFQIEYNYDGYMFVCVATENNKDTVVGNMTIFTQIGTEAAHTGQRISDQLISPSVVETGGTFIVTCDASRAGVPTTATTVRTLMIEWSDGTQQLKPLARYGHNGTQYEAKRLPQTFPARKWAFRFSGTLQRTSNKPKNRNTMKIEMVVYDAKCTDAGLYFCTAIYLNSNKNVSIINSYQNLTIKGESRPVFVSLYSNTRDKIGLRPFQSVIRIGSDVDVTCIIEGPKDLNIRWMFGSRLSNFNTFTPYSGSVVEPVEVSSGTTCVQYLYSSTLKFQTEDKYDGYMYVCVVTENNKDKIFGNITVYNKKGTESAYTSQPRSETILKQNVVNVTTSFTVTCDASRAGVPTNATTILRLTIARTDGTKEPTTLADYNTLTSPYESSFQPESSSMKTWFFEFSGRLDGLPYRLNNRNTMKIDMTIRDARCPDEGLYFCTAIYVNSHNDVLMESRYQNITITGGQVYVSFNSFPRPSGLLVDPSFPLKPSVDWKLFSFEKMDFNLTCIVNGSNNVNIHWKFGSSLSNFSSFTPYPEATGEHFLIDSGTTCEWYFHSSTLSFKTEYKYDGYTYVCVATENNRDTIVANMTLNVTQAWEKSDNLIHPKEVKEGGSFNLTCYASHASVPLNITTVTTLYVEWTDGTQNPVLLARYRTYIPPFQYKFPSYFLPTSNRTINFYGNLQGTSDAPNNRNTMKIEIMVHDAKCTDAGVYFCNASFIDSSTASSYQNLAIVGNYI
ncbi:uncharacterized protein LOC131936191 [Physella acuta]|uniref:uncharacterized protein LOC131936191 n=1 Tax=Physella acuta TaxID=109671 RepID=UPI0027DBC4A3|nr:uncharacterized protein LOC131936191 [Physella acuta]